VSPGADPDIYFPLFHASRRLVDRQPAIRELLFGGQQGPGLARGALADPSKPLLFTMARLDRVKNLAGGWVPGWWRVGLWLEM
jgi:sucrose synthase